MSKLNFLMLFLDAEKGTKDHEIDRAGIFNTSLF